jgi:glucose dehydrogenase
MGRLGRVVVLASSLFAAALLAQSPSTDGTRGGKPYTTWPTYGGGAHSSQYSALDQINKSNVSQLEVVWTFPVAGTVIFNPVVVDDVMYLQASGNTLVAVDAATGKEIWRRQMQGTIGARGMNYWESPDRSDRRLLFIAGGYLTAINAQSGDAITGFGDNGRVDLRIALHRQAAQPLHTGNPGRIFENTMIVSLPAQGASYDATPADVQAYDVRTGRIQWVFHSIPHPGEFGYDTWPPEAYKNSGGVHNWSEFAIDERRGVAFISFGSPRFDFYGGDRPGTNLFGNSLVALDARTGKRIWHTRWCITTCGTTTCPRRRSS